MTSSNMIYGKKILKTQDSGRSLELHFGLQLTGERVKKDSRERQAVQAREALEHCLVTALQDYSDLQITDHHCLTADPKTLVSLSHTTAAAGACFARESQAARGVGLDIEWSDRDINPKMHKFFVNPDDDQLPLLKLWVIKEACFKALDPLLPQELFLKRIWIKGQNFGLIGEAKTYGQFHFWQQETERGTLSCALALTTWRPTPLRPAPDPQL